MARCPNAGPGRFEGQPYPCAAAALEAWAMDGCSDDEVGDATDGPGHWSLFRGPLASGQALADLTQGPEGLAICEPCAAALLAATGGAILTTGCEGFRTANLYGTAAELEADWSALLAGLEETETEA